MDIFEKIFKAVFDALPPEKQALFGSFILAFGVFVVAWTWLTGGRRVPAPGPPPQEPLTGPAWLSLGPAHDALEAVRLLSEQSRAAIELEKSQLLMLRDIDKSLTDVNRGQEFTHRLLESILRNQELGIHQTLSPRPERHRNN